MRIEIRLRGSGKGIALFKTSNATAEDRLLALSPARAINLVRSFLSPLSGQSLFPSQIQKLLLCTGSSPARRLQPRAFLDVLARQISRGSLIVIEIPNPIGHGVPVPAPAAAAPPPEPAKMDELTWVEVVLLDEAGSPLSGQKCKVELPDGSTREVTLDANGSLRVDDIPPGMCQVSFPEVPMNAIAGG